jgi:hypothetical protein
VSQTDQPDAQVWRCTNSSIFSVKSAYHLAKEVEMRGSPAGSKERKDNIFIEDAVEITYPKHN